MADPQTTDLPGDLRALAARTRVDYDAALLKAAAARIDRLSEALKRVSKMSPGAPGPGNEARGALYDR